MVSRLREQNMVGEMLSYAIFSYSLPRKSAIDADALCSFTGLGEDERVIMPAKDYWGSAQSKSRFFLVAGHNKNEKTWKKFSPEILSKPPFNIKRFGGVIIEEQAVHTKDQAVWLCEKIEELSITSCAIFATPFHLLRAYLTVIAELKKRKIRIPIIPVPVSKSPSAIVPEMGKDAWALVQGEIERINLYQEKGDVVSYKEFRDYMDWLWKQPIIKDRI